jgi:hypothetical protein
VAPLNVVPGAVVSLMERSNVETVIVAGRCLKWKGRLLGVDLNRLRATSKRRATICSRPLAFRRILFRPD